MARRDVTTNCFETLEELTKSLRSEGFDVDHFHGVDVDETGEEWVVHISPDGENDRWHELTTPDGWKRLVADEWHD